MVYHNPPANASELKVGESGAIARISDDNMACKLLAMGVLPGKKVTLVRRAGWGDTLYLRVASHTLALRLSEAKQVELLIF